MSQYGKWYLANFTFNAGHYYPFASWRTSYGIERVSHEWARIGSAGWERIATHLDSLYAMLQDRTLADFARDGALGGHLA